MEIVVNFFNWIYNGILSILNWCAPAIQVIYGFFDGAPDWAVGLSLAVVAISITIFILNLGGD